MFCLILVLVSLLNLAISICPKHCNCKEYTKDSTQLTFLSSSREYIVDCVDLGLNSFPPGIHANVTHLYLSGNKFQHITRKMFVKFKKIKFLDLSSNEISSLEKGAFDELVDLEILDLTANYIPEIYQDHFGNISRLRELMLTNNLITKVAAGSFDTLASLEDLHLSESLIETPPIFNVPSSVMHLYLDHTNINLLTPDSFKHYSQVIGLYLKGSKIKYLCNHVFRHATQLKYLLMEYSSLTHIAENAFEGLQLQTLILQGTSIRSLPFRGLAELLNLNLREVPNLWELRPSYLPNIRQLLVTYEFLCCPFMNRLYEDTGEIGRTKEWNIQECKNMSTQSPRKTFRPTLRGTRVSTTRRQQDDKNDPFFIEFSNDSSYSLTLDPCDPYVLPSGSAPLARTRKKKVLCLPKPDEFNPCEDLLGTTALRVCTWVVTVCAVIGNLVKLVVIMLNRRKVDNHKLLMCTLAFANLCMGLYLLILASVDLQSSGHYNQYAKEWQFGGGCKTAGFLSIFSTQLAVFTLNLVTLERYYTIVYPLHKDKWITVRQTTALLALSIVIAGILATLPLTGVNSYSKVAICLPFDVENTSSKIYVTFLLVSNGASFFSVLFSYVKMYRSIQRTRTSFADLSVAKNMAIIVFTNFSCWAPIAVFSLIAIYGQPVIDVSISKVLLVFVYPINAFTNPFLYFLVTKRFKHDLHRALTYCGLCKKYFDPGLSGERITSARMTRTLLASTGRSQVSLPPRHPSSRSSLDVSRSTPSRGSVDVSRSTPSRGSVDVSRSTPSRGSVDVSRRNSSRRESRVGLFLPSARDIVNSRRSSVSTKAGRRKSYEIAAKNNNLLHDATKNVCEDMESSVFVMVLLEDRNNDRRVDENMFPYPKSVLYESTC